MLDKNFGVSPNQLFVSARGVCERSVTCKKIIEYCYKLMFMFPRIDGSVDGMFFRDAVSELKSRKEIEGKENFVCWI